MNSVSCQILAAKGHPNGVPICMNSLQNCMSCVPQRRRIADVDRKIMLCSHHHLRYFPHGFAVGSPAKKPDGALRLAVVSESPSFTSASRVRGLVKIRTTLVETAQLQRILKYRNQRYRHRETRLKNGVSSLVIAES